MEIRAPGKLMLSGEWSVLENAPCIVLAVDKTVTAQIKESNEINFTAKAFGINQINAKFIDNELIIDANDSEKKRLLFVANATKTALIYLTEKNIPISNFSL
ncbi:MAG: hypothetical protein PHQ98_03835, partial [Candidatus ainarchaeum sp.]|nr:hypothetical protein [Candidatus ainarchaeum sp.]